MKHLTVLTVVLLATCLVSPASAQISWGGKPFSFNNHMEAPISTITLPPVVVAALLAEDEVERQQARPRPPRFAKALDLDLGLDNAGSWTVLPTKDRLWRLRINSPGALSLSLIFSEFYMPRGATLYVFSEDRSTVLGAFTSANNKPYGKFSTSPIPGDVIILEYYEPSWVHGEGQLRVSKVAHAYRDIFGRDDQAGLNGHGDSASCNINVSCSQGSAWQDEKHAVAMVLLSDGTRWCSGALVNNTDQDDTPYFLTAFHCADTNGNQSLSQAEVDDAETWIFRFNYDSPQCTPSSEPYTWQSISGATFRAGKAASDFTLMELSTMTPYAYPYYAGWSRSTAAPTSVVGIHHPAGDLKKISLDSDSPTLTSITGGSNTHWYVDDWDEGTTEGGSSGSPLFDQSSRIIGQDHAGDGPDACDPDKGTYYGAFHKSWDNGSSSSTRLKDWLDPSSTGSTTLNGKYGILPPEPPSNLVITNAQSQASPILSWTASPSSNVAHYEIYRCPSYYRNCFSYGATIGTTTGTSYTDFTLTMTSQSEAYDEFSYRVRAVSSDDVESAYTNWASVWGDPLMKRDPEEEEELLPTVVALAQNHPNPFNPQTAIRFALPEAKPVLLVVYDVTGREVVRLVEGFVAAGNHEVSFDGTRLPSGVYLYRLQAGDFIATKRMALIK